MKRLPTKYFVEYQLTGHFKINKLIITVSVASTSTGSLTIGSKLNFQCFTCVEYHE